MGRSACCSKEGLNRGAWTALEDKILISYIKIHGEGKWRSLPKRAGKWITTLLLPLSLCMRKFGGCFRYLRRKKLLYGGRWSAGLKRCGKSCRLRWLNYLRPDIKRGNISDDEEELIIRLHKLLGNRYTFCTPCLAHPPTCHDSKYRSRNINFTYKKVKYWKEARPDNSLK